MQLGLIGLGKMGADMARRLARSGVDVVGFDLSAEARGSLVAEEGVWTAASIPELLERLPPPRVVWLMLPAGEATESALRELTTHLEGGDVVVDGANSHYRDSMRRAAEIGARGVDFVDAGVSGGIWGLKQGYTVMLGGAPMAVAKVLQFARILAPSPEQGWIHCGPVGAGHFTKMVHNGIEYGLMQAYAEGFALLRAKREFELDVAAIAETWRHGSVVRSWLLDLTAGLLGTRQTLEDVAPIVPDSGEGRWTAQEAVELGVPAPVISLALMARFASQGGDDYGNRLLALMRASFGGHAVKEL